MFVKPRQGGDWEGISPGESNEFNYAVFGKIN
jgi:hypothetical protein